MEASFLTDDSLAKIPKHSFYLNASDIWDYESVRIWNKSAWGSFEKPIAISPANRRGGWNVSWATFPIQPPTIPVSTAFVVSIKLWQEEAPQYNAGHHGRWSVACVDLFWLDTCCCQWPRLLVWCTAGQCPHKRSPPGANMKTNVKP